MYATTRTRSGTADEANKPEKEDKSIAPLIGTAVPKEGQEANMTRKEKAALNKRLPVWRQEALDEQGRKRFHGAFSGGFSAGYFNTVGSKEGWTPSQFVSSRESRAGQRAARPEDFMDTEDFQELGLGAHGIREREEFAAAGSTASDKARAEAIRSSTMPEAFIGPARDPIGVKLLKLMGWRQGKGIGPRKQRVAPAKPKRVYGVVGLTPQVAVDEKGEDGEDDIDDPYACQMLYAPEDTSVALFAQKNDFYGVGYDPYKDAPEFGSASVHSVAVPQRAAPQRIALGAGLQATPRGFGLGALEDADEDDIYHHDSMENYDSELLAPGSKRQKTSEAHRRAIVIDAEDEEPIHAADRSHITGFVRARRPVILNQEFPGPEVPRDFNPRKRLLAAQHQQQQQKQQQQQHKLPESFGSLTNIVLADKRLIPQLTADQRGRLLGEQQLTATPKQQPPPPLLVPPPPPPSMLMGLSSRFTTASPSPSPSAAPPSPMAGALEKSGQIAPFKDDPPKQLRYEFWVQVQRGLAPEPKFWNDGLTEEERSIEHDEFKLAWGMFGKLPAMLAKRFERAGTAAAKEANEIKVEDHTKLAAANKMFGSLTRTTTDWAPQNLLCKRFNVRNPRKVAPRTHGQQKKTSGSDIAEFALPDHLGPAADSSGNIRLEPDLEPQKERPVSDDEADFKREEDYGDYNPEEGTGDAETPEGESAPTRKEPVIEDKPSIDLFKAIFEDDEETELNADYTPNILAEAANPLADPNLASAAPVMTSTVFSSEGIDALFGDDTNQSNQPSDSNNNSEIGPVAPVSAQPLANKPTPTATNRVIKDFSNVPIQYRPTGDAESDSSSSSSDSEDSSSSSESRHKRRSKHKHKRRSKHKDSKRRHKDKDKHKRRKDKKDKDRHRDKDKRSDKKRKRSRSRSRSPRK